MEGISIGKLLIVGALIVLLFGTNKLRTLGADLGAAIKGFKKAMSEGETSESHAAKQENAATNPTPKD